MQNWAGSYEFQAKTVHYPRTVDEVRETVARAARIGVLGSRHSFHGIADSEGGELVSLRHLDRVLRLDLDPARPTVTVEGGIVYGPLCRFLHGAGLALPNLASLPHISVAGACATGTHGSGDALQCLAAAVSALKVVDARGEIRVLTREKDGETFEGAVVALGALGVVVELTLDVGPAFELRQRVWEELPLARVRDVFDALTGSAYSVSLFTDWQGETFNQAWLKSRVETADPDLTGLGARPATGPRHPVQGSAAEAEFAPVIDPEKCTEQLGRPGSWHTRLPHFREDEEPSSSGEELQTEYLIPREHAVRAFDALRELGPQLRPMIQISEVRTVAADRLWLSPACQRPSVALHFTWRKDPEGVADLLPLLEACLAPFEARPHWGKLFAMDGARLRDLYPRLSEFRELARTFDPEGKFRNRFLDRCVFRD